LAKIGYITVQQLEKSQQAWINAFNICWKNNYKDSIENLEMWN